MGLTFIPGSTLHIDTSIKKQKPNVKNRYYGTYMMQVGVNPLTEPISIGTSGGGEDVWGNQFVMNPGDICEFKSIELVTIPPTDIGWVYETEEAGRVGLKALDPRKPPQIATPLIWRMVNASEHPVVVTYNDALIYLGIFTP